MEIFFALVVVFLSAVAFIVWKVLEEEDNNGFW